MKGVKTKPIMTIFILLKLVEKSPRHSNHGDMLTNNHISLRIVVNIVDQLEPRS